MDEKKQRKKKQRLKLASESGRGLLSSDTLLWSPGDGLEVRIKKKEEKKTAVKASMCVQERATLLRHITLKPRWRSGSAD